MQGRIVVENKKRPCLQTKECWPTYPGVEICYVEVQTRWTVFAVLVAFAKPITIATPPRLNETGTTTHARLHRCCSPLRQHNACNVEVYHWFERGTEGPKSMYSLWARGSYCRKPAKGTNDMRLLHLSACKGRTSPCIQSLGKLAGGTCGPSDYCLRNIGGYRARCATVRDPAVHEWKSETSRPHRIGTAREATEEPHVEDTIPGASIICTAN
jgi:hypothetical protein